MDEGFSLWIGTPIQARIRVWIGGGLGGRLRLRLGPRCAAGTRADSGHSPFFFSCKNTAKEEKISDCFARLQPGFDQAGAGPLARPGHDSGQGGLRS